MKQFTVPTTPSRRLRLAGLAVSLLAFGLPAGTAGAAAEQSHRVTALERLAVDKAYSQMGVYEPAGDNDLNGSPPYELSFDGNKTFQPWCGSFLNWVMRSAGINPQRAERGGTSFNVNVAKAWSVYGPKGGGYGRYASAYDAMPGDLLVYGYDGTASGGGHVTMVVAPTDNARYVWTVGGNEGNRVRLQKRDLAASGAYLVTLLEFRTRKSNIFREYNTQLTDVGDVYFRRFHSGGLPRLQVTQVSNSTGTYTGSAIDSAGYRTRSNAGTWSSTQVFGTLSLHTYVHLVRSTDTSASLAEAPTSINYSLASSSSGTT